MKEDGERWRYTLTSAASVAAILLLWALVSGTGVVRRSVLPAPWDLWEAFRLLLRDGYADKPLARHVVASIARTLSGFGLALALGVPVGLLIGWNRWVAAVLSPLLAFVRPIPPIAFVPLFILYFGIGETAKVLVIFLVAFWYMILNASAGVAAVSREWVRAGLNLGLTRRQLFTSVILPGALPQIFTGVKTAIAVSWALVVAAELIAAQEGIGHIIMDAATFNRTRDVFVGIILIGLIGFALERMVGALEARMLHWQGR
jgi:ABC-type nitrate/sulfonate/bicarbonate transport system permease component